MMWFSRNPDLKASQSVNGEPRHGMEEERYRGRSHVCDLDRLRILFWNYLAISLSLVRIQLYWAVSVTQKLHVFKTYNLMGLKYTHTHA